MKTVCRESLLAFLLIFSIQVYVKAQNASGTYNMPVQKDAYVFEETPNTNFGEDALLIAGRGLEFGYVYRIYMKFDHTPIPEDATVISADLHVYMKAATADNYKLKLQQNSQLWNESSITWIRQPASAYLTDISTQRMGDSEDWVQFDVSSTVQGWIDGRDNEGLVIRADNESGDMQNCVFYSKESGGCKPYIHVVYTSNERIPESPDAPVCNMSGDLTVPELELSFSANPSTAGEAIEVEARAEDPEGIHLIQLYKGSRLLTSRTDITGRTVLTAKSTLIPFSPGPTMYFAVAYNDRMQCTRMARRLLVLEDGEPPVLNLYHEPLKPALGERVTIYASAEDPSGITYFDIEVNGVKHSFPLDPGATSTTESLVVEEAEIYYDPANTRVVSYQATAYDQEGYHTSSGLHHILYDNGSGPDGDRDGIDDDIEEILGIDSNSNDTDNDGLYDYWEVFGLDRDNDGDIDLDLPGMGASPHHKDLFVEMDWMEDASHSHKPHPWAIQTAINQFLCYGIRMHVDAGSMGGGNAIPHVENFVEDDDKLNYLLNTKLANCETARFGIFRYVICGHGWGQYFGTGNMYLRTDPPNGDNQFDEPYFQARQFIHEVGHSLGLGHGGQSRTSLAEAYSLDRQCFLFRNDIPQWINTNYKPNYLSIMNYLYEEQNGIKARTLTGDDIIIQGFSQNIYRSNDLDEYHLNESEGFEYPLDWGMYTWRRAGDTHHKLNDWFEGYYYLRFNGSWILADGSPIDWDLDGNSSENDVAANINIYGDTVFSNNLSCDNDVENFIFQIRSSHQDRFLANGGSRVVYELTDEVCDGLDNDSDGMIDEGFPDLDYDGVADFLDNAIGIYNPRQEDMDQNFVGDVAEIPLGKVMNLHGKFDPVDIYAELHWYRPKPAEALLGYNVYMKDHSGVFKRMGISYPSTLKETFSHRGPFSLDYTDSLTYYVRPVNLYLQEGAPSEHIRFFPKISTLSVEESENPALSVQCYPNPFSTVLHISYTIQEPEYVCVSIYNLLGEEVRSLISEYQTSGEHTLSWDGTGNNHLRLPYGIYLCKVQSAHSLISSKIIMSR